MKKRFVSLILTLVLLFSSSLSFCNAASFINSMDNKIQTQTINSIDKDGRYSSKNEVALYIHLYKCLPCNYITKAEAKKLGWIPSKGNLWKVTDKMSIGGDVFTNRQKVLPTKYGRIWHECDINYNGGRRGCERIVYSNDNLIFYTNDHYQSFTQLY